MEKIYFIISFCGGMVLTRAIRKAELDMIIIGGVLIVTACYMAVKG